MFKSFLAVLLLTSVSATKATDEHLDRAQVTIPYSELKVLLDAARAGEEKEAPLPASIAEAHYELELGRDIVRGTARFAIESFSDKRQVVPLLDAEARLTSVTPERTKVLIEDHRYALVTESAGRTSVTLGFVVPWNARMGPVPRLVVKRPESLVSTLAFKGVPEGSEVSVEGGTLVGERFRLGVAGPLDVRLLSTGTVAAATAQDARPRVKMVQAVVTTASSSLRVVPDGSLLNEMRYTVRHEGPVAWNLSLPTGSELLSCSIDGKPFAPVDRGEGQLELLLPSPGAKPTEIALSYANRVAALAPVSGNVEIELPLTPLLIHEVQWQIDLPSGYELAALDGNVVAVDAISQNGLRIRLRKELCRNERPAVQIFYNKPIKGSEQ